MLTLRLPFPPSVNNYWRHNRGRTHISHEGEAFRSAVRASVWAMLGRPTPLEGRLGLIVHAHAPDRLRRDLDNTLKASLDAMQHAGLYADDSQIDLLLVRRGVVAPGGAMVVKLGVIDEAAVPLEVSP